MARKYRIPMKLVREAYNKSQRIPPEGKNGISTRQFRLSRTKRLRRLWQELCAGRYKPSPLRIAYKRKPSGGRRTVRVPAVRDRIVLYMLRKQLSRAWRNRFYSNSFLHQKGNKKRAAIEVVRRNCLRRNWVALFDVQRFGDHVNHRSLLRIINKSIHKRWVSQYTYRMLKAPTRRRSGSIGLFMLCREARSYSESGYRFVLLIVR